MEVHRVLIFYHIVLKPVASMSPLILSNFIVKSESVKQNCQFSFPQR